MTTTNINAFVKAVKTVIESRLEGYEVTEQNIVKMNDITNHGLVIRRKGDNAGATLYLDEAFKDFIINGETVESIADSIAETALRAERYMPTEAENMDLSFDAIKDRLSCRLVDTERNEAYLEEHPHRFIGAGLAVVAEINLGRDYSIVITNSMAEEYDIFELFDTALSNMQTKYPAKLISLEGALFGNSENVLDSSDGSIEGVYTLMIDGEHGFGASTLAYKGIAERIRELFRGSYFILPSSLHEVILIKDDGTTDEAELKAMVTEANRSVVEPSDILSDSVFHYGADGLRRVA